MTTIDDLLGAIDALATATFNAYNDAAYASLQTRLFAAHVALIYQAKYAISNATAVGAKPQPMLDGARTACDDANAAFGAAGTFNERKAAVDKAFDAIEAVRPLLPEALRDFT